MAGANPIGLAVTAVVGIGAAMAVYASTQGEARTELEEYNDELDVFREKTKLSKKSIENTNQAYEDSTKEVKTNYGAVQLLSDKLYSLADKENKSNSEKSQMQSLVNQLNESLPNLNMVLNEQNGLLSVQQSEMNGLIASMKATALAKAQEEKYLELAKAQVEAEVALTEVQNEKATAQSNYNAKYAEYEEALKRVNAEEKNSEYGEATTEAYNSLNILTEEVGIFGEKIGLADVGSK